MYCHLLQWPCSLRSAPSPVASWNCTIFVLYCHHSYILLLYASFWSSCQSFYVSRMYRHLLEGRATFHACTGSFHRFQSFPTIPGVSVITEKLMRLLLFAPRSGKLRLLTFSSHWMQADVHACTGPCHRFQGCRTIPGISVTTRTLMLLLFSVTRGGKLRLLPQIFFSLDAGKRSRLHRALPSLPRMPFYPRYIYYYLNVDATIFSVTRGGKLCFLIPIFLSMDASELLGIVQENWILYVSLSFSQSANQVWWLTCVAYVDAGQRCWKIAK